MFEQVGDFSYFRTIVCEGCPGFVCVDIVGVSLVGFFCCVCRFVLCRRFCGKLLFVIISCINFHSFCFLCGVHGSKCILVIWYLKAATLCSTGRFERKLMVVSVVVGLRNMSITSLGGFRITSRSRKFIRQLLWCVGLSSVFVCIWFMCVLMRSGRVLLVSYTG
jgi:hypothetical protein